MNYPRNSLVLLLLAIGTVCTAGEPQMREGLWSIHTMAVSNPGNKKEESITSICHSHAYDEHVQEVAKQQMSSCKTISEGYFGRTKTSETECVIRGSMVRTKTTVTITDLNARSQTHTTYTPAAFGMTEMTMIMEQKYVGACPAGVEPGDVVGSDGRIEHLWKH